LQTGRGIPVDLTLAAEFVAKSADSNDADCVNSFGCSLELSKGVEPDAERAVRYYQRTSSLLHADGM
jgi:TPR repeat protein